MAARGIKHPLLRIQGVPVLMYHHISHDASGPDKYCVPIAALRVQLASLIDGGYRAISIDAIRTGTVVGEHVCAITFDDGTESDYRDAFPLLAEFGLKATFFPSTAYIGRTGYLSWSEIHEMNASGMWFGSHGHEHVDMARLPRAVCAGQLKFSRNLLEQNLGAPATCFAAPYGLINPRLLRMAQDAGFQVVCTSRNWPASAGRNVIGRIAIYGGTNLREFQRLVSGSASSLLRRNARDAALFLPKRALLRWWPHKAGVRLLQEAR